MNSDEDVLKRWERKILQKIFGSNGELCRLYKHPDLKKIHQKG